METDRPLPSMVDTERTHLGNMVLYPALRTRENAALFYVPQYSTVAAKLVEIHNAGLDREYDTDGTAMHVASLLEAEGKLEQVGGADMLRSLLNALPNDIDPQVSPALAEATAERLREVARRRRVAIAANSLAAAACDPHATTERLEALRSALVDAATPARRKLDVSKKAAMQECMDRLDHMVKTHSFVTGLRSGWEELDDMLGGFRESTFTVLGARPSMGKTAFGLSFAWSVAVNLPEDAGEVVFVTAEMGVPNLLERLVGNISDVPIRKAVKRGALKGELQELGKAIKRVKAARLEFVDANGVDVDELAAHLRERHKTRPISLLVVDYLQLLRCGRMEEQGRYAVVSEVSRILTGLAHGLDIPVFALAQLSRESAKAKDKTPGLTDLRESGAIEQDADAVLLLHRPDYYEAQKEEPDKPNSIPVHEAKVIIAKNREGATGVTWFEWRPDVQRFNPRKEASRG